MGLALKLDLDVERQSLACDKQILFVINADWFFLSHRRTLAHAIKRMGYEVHVASPDTGCADEIRQAGFHFIELPSTLKGLSLNLLAEIRAFKALVKLYSELQPDIVHHSTPKVVLMGTLAAKAVKGMRVVNLISGLGYTFSKNLGARLIRPLACLLFRVALRHKRCCTVFQNPEDRAFFIDQGLVKAEHTDIIRGSGVDCSLFAPQDENCAVPTVLLASRLLWDKGVGEFVESARLLKDEYPETRFVLVGRPDQGNPSSIPERKIREWVDEGCVEWWGQRSDMPSVMAGSSVVVLPSYHEGLPKTLIEAGAAGRPVVATDIAGCREVVKHEVNGLLVPVGSSVALAEAIARLLSSPDLRREYGDAGRTICLQEFDEKIIADKFLAVCNDLTKQPVAVSIS